MVKILDIQIKKVIGFGNRNSSTVKAERTTSSFAQAGQTY